MAGHAITRGWNFPAIAEIHHELVGECVAESRGCQNHGLKLRTSDIERGAADAGRGIVQAILEFMGVCHGCVWTECTIVGIQTISDQTAQGLDFMIVDKYRAASLVETIDVQLLILRSQERTVGKLLGSHCITNSEQRLETVRIISGISERGKHANSVGA